MNPMTSNRARRIRLALVAGSMMAVGLAACDDTNRFAGPGIPGGGGGAGTPDVTVGEVRATTPVGDSLLVSASVQDLSGIESITFVGRTLRGDPGLGTDETVERFEEKVVVLGTTPSDTTVARFLQPTEDTERETTFIVVKATDTEGLTSMDSVAVVVGGPAVRFENLAAAQSGTDLPLEVVANDPDGVSSVRIDITGVVDTTIVQEISPVRDTARVDTLLFIPAGTPSGNLELLATAVNNRGISGSTPTRTIAVSQTGATDLVSPSLSLVQQSPARLEKGSEVSVTLTGSDNPGGTGVRSAGITVLAISPTRADTLIRDSVVQFDRGRSGTVSRDFSFRPFNVDSLSLPDTLIFEISGFFVDDAGNCGAATGSEEQSLACETIQVGGATGRVADGVTGLRIEREVVAGETVLLPAGGMIMDAAVDTLRKNLFLSNIEQNRVEVFRLEDELFGDAIAVGSEPWGLDMVTDFTAPDPDSLVVANSNGTNLELIDLDQEIARPEERFFFPDVVLFDVRVEDGDAGILITVIPRPQLALLDFSDRPQYLAVDTFGNRIFSTLVADPLDEVGTVRKSFFEEDWEQPETKIFVEHAVFEEVDDQFAFAHVDDVQAAGGVLTLVDHVLGFPDQVITGSADLNAGETPADAVAEIRGKGSDVFWANGAWNVQSLGFNDTTFVSASGDGTWVAIGEGAEPEVGRVLMHRAEAGEGSSLSGNVPVADLITNRPEPVRGIGLNYDGTLGVVRGSSEVAFFDVNLRKQGGTQTVDGGAGAALHPLHADQPTLANLGGTHLPDVHLAFVGTGDGSIDIVDTFRFLRIGSVRIRDRVTGPIRAVLPFPSDNANFNCPTIPVQDRRGVTIGTAVQLYQNGDFFQPDDGTITDDECVVVKLFAVTEAGGVVVIDVRKADILRFHPQR